MSSNQNNAKVVTTCNQRLAALAKYVKTKTQMTVVGQPMKLSDLTAIYQAALDTRSTLLESHTAYEQALKARNGAETTRLATDKGLKAWVITTFGAGSAQASDFGFSPATVKAKSAETKALAVKKVLATRKARMTLGKRQKASIKGTVEAPTAPADPAITAPAATPAAVAPTVVTSAPNGAPATNGVAGH